MAKPGLDGHDRGAKTITRALRDHGFEVIYTGLHQTPEQIAETALQEDVDAVGLSLLSGAHNTLFPRVMEELRTRGLGEVLVFGGGVIPDADARTLKEQGVAQVAGREPGLYGGTRNAAACDPPAMIAFLEQNPDKAAAWAGVQGIAAADIRTYIEGLTPVVLTRDTRVTNHGFRNGQAYAHPSVLQAGHAVLVDAWGVPRAKCSCGNPLAPPVPLATPPVYVGPRWPTFDPLVIIVVVATDPVVDGFVLVDLTSGVLIIRPIGADPGAVDLATGDVRVTLRWATTADIDLSVTDPTGETVSYGNRSVSTGGTLDVDANAPCATATAGPVENIIWPDTAPDGRYVITVNLYNPCDAGDTQSFELTAFVGGFPVQLFLGGADGGDHGFCGRLGRNRPGVEADAGQGKCRHR